MLKPLLSQRFRTHTGWMIIHTLIAISSGPMGTLPLTVIMIGWGWEGMTGTG